MHVARCAVVVGQVARDQRAHLARRAGRAEAGELCPESRRIAFLAHRHRAQFGVLLFEHERLARPDADRLAIAAQDRGAGLAGADRQRRIALGEQRAGREAHQIDRVRHRLRFVEIVDAPDQPAFGIAPGAEILDMQIADR